MRRGLHEIQGVTSIKDFAEPCVNTDTLTAHSRAVEP